MFDLKRFVSMLWLPSLLTLLASVPLAPVRPSGFIAVSPQPDGLARNLSQIQGQCPPLLNATIAIDAVPEVDALPFEGEEQDGADAVDDPRVAFIIPCSFRKVPDLRLVAPRFILSHYPLRC